MPCEGVVAVRSAPAARSRKLLGTGCYARKEGPLAFHVNHIHLKSLDPRRTAAWYAEAFNFVVTGENVRPEPFGDLLVRCETADGGISVLISGPRTGEQLGPGDASAHLGLEHFGVEVEDIDAEIARLAAMGAVLLEGPMTMATGLRIAFIKAPDDVRIELLQRP